MKKHIKIAAVIVTLMIVGCLFFLVRHFILPSKSVSIEGKSIAVLPFENLSGDKKNEYFSDGITADIISRLSKIGDLKVISPASVLQYKKSDKSPSVIGKELDVAAILGGSVSRTENRVQIECTLIETKTGELVWSETYDREKKDIFAVQEKISLTLAKKLNARLSSEEKAAIVKRSTENLEAFDLYLKGSSYRNTNWNTEMAYYQQAIRKDPDYALAHAGIARIFCQMGWWWVPPKGTFPNARAAVEKALGIDDTLGEAHTVSALISLFYDWDWTAAESSFKRAIELDPGNVEAHLWYADFLMAMGRLDEALAEIEHAMEFDPLSSEIYYEAIMIYSLAGKYDEALELLQKAREIYQNDWYDNVLLNMCEGKLNWQQGKYTEAVEAFQKLTEFWSGWIRGRALLGNACGLSGEREKAEEILLYLKELPASWDVPSLSIATVQMGLGEIDRAFELLDKAYDERDSWLPYIKVWPEFEPIRSDPRYNVLVKKMGL